MATIRLKEAKTCEQCGTNVATCYAIDRIPGGWGGHYCEGCANDLGFMVVDRYIQPGEVH